MSTALEREPAVDRTLPETAAWIWRAFVVLVLCLYAGYLVRTISDDSHNWRPYIAIGGIFSGVSIGLGKLACLAWTKIDYTGIRRVLTAVLVWHALFGPVMLAQRIVTEVSRNDDIAHFLWPHVIHWINSL